MPYIFPRRIPIANETFDVDEFVRDIAPPAELLAGRVNEVNIATAAGGLPADEDAFFTFDIIESSVPFGFFDAGAPPHNPPPETRAELEALTGVHIIANTLQWEPVDAFTDFDSGFEQLIITANYQYVWAGFEPSGGEPAHAYACDLLAWTDAALNNYYRMNEPPAFQLGIRVDGEIVYVSGIFNATWRDFWGIRADPAVQVEGTRFPGFISRKAQASMSPGQPMMVVPLEAQVNITPGQHTVEIVARRVPRVDQQRFVEDDCVGLLSRVALLTRLHNEPVRDRSSLVAVNLAGLAEGDTMSQATVFTNNVERIETALNDIGVDSLADFALVREHLAPPVPLSSGTPVYGYETWAFTPPTTVTIKNWLNSETSNTVELVNLTGTTNWTALQDGAGNVIYCTPNAGASFPTASYAGVLEVRARVHMDKLARDTINAAAIGSLSPLCGFAIAYTAGGSTTVIDSSIRFVSRAATAVNNTDVTYFPASEDIAGLVDDELDVALYAVIDTRTVRLASNITNFFVVAANVNFSSIAVVRMEYTHVVITATYLGGA